MAITRLTTGCTEDFLPRPGLLLRPSPAFSRFSQTYKCVRLMARRLQIAFRSILAKTIPTAFPRNSTLYSLTILILGCLLCPRDRRFRRALTGRVTDPGRVKWVGAGRV